MTAGRFLLRRALFALLLVFAVSSLAFIVTHLTPCTADDPTVPRAVVEERCHQLGLDRPLLVQYREWLVHAARLDFGPSIVFPGRRVNDLLAERAINTAVLASVALVGATLIGIPLGVYVGSRPHGPLPMLLRALSLVVLSIPPLLASLLLVVIAARTGWLPVGGMTSLAVHDASWGAWLADLAQHVPLPAMALGVPLAATLERLQAQSIAEAAREPFVRAAQARGVSWRRAIGRHAWPVSLGPLLGLYGAIIGGLFSGSFVVEVVTAWPGLGRLMYDALRGRDLFLVAGCAAAGAFFIGVGTFLSDVMLVMADPRRRLGGRA